jgi:DNA-nicking Smr family endonuclease
MRRAPEPPKDTSQPIDDVGAEFRAAVGSVRPLRRGPARVESTPARVSSRRGRPAAVADPVPLNAPFIAADETVRIAQPGTPARHLARLDGESFAVDAELDLHGLTLAQAAPALAHFLAECQRRGCERLRIIHGRGLRSEGAQPVLKGFVIASLNGHPAVVALRSAGRRDGGSGALRVLLRRA